MATGYCTNWGNDANDGLTWETAKRTFQGAKDAGLDPIYAKGWFSEYLSAAVDTTSVFKGFNKCIISGISGVTTAVYKQYGYIQGFIIKNIYYGIRTKNNLYGINNCYLYNCVLPFSDTYNNYHEVPKSVSYTIVDIASDTRLNQEFFKSTIHKGGVVNLYNLGNILGTKFKEFIINNSSIDFNRKMFPIYSLFIHSTFKFRGGGLGTDETAYSYPTGNTDDEKLQNLRDRMATVYGGQASDYLVGCKYYSRDTVDETVPGNPAETAYQDIFVDADNGNFYLKEGCIAANMAYDGSYIGAKPVGTKIALTDFTLSNIDANGKITDQEVDATADSVIIDLQKVRKISEWSALGERAARNGQQVNTVSNLGSPISAGSNVLTAGKTYMVINDVITLDNAAGTSYNPWETFVAVDEGGGAGLGFSTAGTGQVQEVLISEYDQKIKVKCSKTDSALSTANLLTFYLHEQPMVNVDANGVPTLGNADAGYDANTAVELYTRYMQFNVLVKANNLPAR